jgi:mycothiol synthase
LLSNLLGLKDGRTAGDSVVIRPAGPDDMDAAMRLILSPPGAAADSHSIQDFISFAHGRGIAFDGLHIAQSAGKIVSAMLPVISPGRTMLILSPPGGQGKAIDSATEQLVDPVCHFGAASQIQLAQTLVDPQDSDLEGIFTAQSFVRMAELYYLQAQPTAEMAFPKLPDGLAWTPYSTEAHPFFSSAILDSYHGSLDCPALNGRRDIEDIIAGHKASGIFDPSIWFLLREGAICLGVLLLSQSPRSDAVELVYLGLSPAARGRKLGELMVQQALAVTAAHGQPRLCLAVDSRNTPALKLYYRHGMHRLASKIALLRDLSTLPPQVR